MWGPARSARGELEPKNVPKMGKFEMDGPYALYMPFFLLGTTSGGVPTCTGRLVHFTSRLQTYDSASAQTALGARAGASGGAWSSSMN